jgi:hypothetical protein
MQQNFIFPDLNGIRANGLADLNTSNLGGASKKENGANFLALLQRRQNSDLEGSEMNSSAEVSNKVALSNSILTNGWDFTAQKRFSNTNSGVETKKVEHLQKANSNNAKAQETTTKAPCKAQENNVDHKETKINSSKTNETNTEEEVNKLEEGAVRLMEGDDLELELCPEELDTVLLEDFFAQLSEEELAHLMETEDGFEDRLQALIQEVEDPEVKAQLLEFVEENAHKDLFSLVQPLVVQELEVTQKVTETLELDLEAVQDLTSGSKRNQVTLKPKEEAKGEDGSEMAQDEQEVTLATSENKMEMGQDTAKAEKTETKKSFEEVKSGIETGESLRQEFARIHKMDEVETMEMPVDTTELGFEAGDFAINELFEGSMAPTTSNLSQIYNMVDKLVEKAFEQLGGKVGKADHGGFEKGGLEAGLTRGVVGSGASNGSSGSSMGNGGGFSFQPGLGHGLSGEVGKSGQGLGTNGTNFAQMLERAELVKTKDGMKVLNLEIDQGEMGKLEMELKSKDGVVTARLSAENVMVKAELEKLTPQILERLMAQGINLESINVDVSSNNSQGKRSGETADVSASRSKLSFGAGASFDDLIEGSSVDVLTELRRAALNIQYIDEIV